jgi:uncharacterized protein (TIGR03437 family)
MFLHRQAQRARAARMRPLAAAPVVASTNRDIGNVAIIEDSDGVVEKLNQFDLNGATLTFTPLAGGVPRYRYAYSGPGYDTSAAAQGSPVIALGDDDAREFDLPFAFSFYGATYRQVFLNSDGNLTFTAAEFASSSRSVGRMTGGPPRISPLFDDLDPSQPGGSVRFFADASHVVFSWVNEPEYGPGAPQTFQVRLNVDGSIQFSYSAVNPASAVVGIAPGFAQPGTSVVSFLNDVSAEYSAAVVERFGNTVDIDIVSLAQKFYQTHEDAYDYLVVYNNMRIDAMAGALAYEATVRSNGTGYSVAQQDYGQQYGSAARLRSVMNMGRLDDYPADVNATVPVRSAAQDTPMTVLGHESGHLFLAFASIPDPAGSTAKPMIGYGGAHWSFVYDSEASLDEGEQITDLGSGRFVTAAVTQGFAPLDRYLMGFSPASDVPDTFVALNPSVSPLGHPQSGVAFTGTRLNISVNDVIQALGPRTPDYTVAQHRFRFGFIVVVPSGTLDSPLTTAAAQQVETYRQQFVAAYTKFSANVGTADTTLNHTVRLSLFPAAGVVAGASASATISLQTPPAADLVVRLAAPAGFVQVPAQVTVAAGASSASFSVSGIKAGVEELLATPADSSYEVAYARVQVAAPSQLTLRKAIGNPFSANVAAQLTDVNGLPYPGARIVAAASSGNVTPAIATADATGLVSFQWTPGGDPVSQLKLSVENAPAVSLTLTAGSAVPVISTVVNAASFAAGVAPGSLATLFGVNLSGATVLWNGVDVQPSYASDTQVNFYVSAQAPLGANVITVTAPSGPKVSATINLVSAQPGIFSGAVVHADTGVSALATPVSAGDYIAIYCTGLGPTKVSGGLARTTVTPTVYLGSTAVTPSYSGLAPGFVGLYQVDVQIPPGIPAGTLALVITSGSAYSNEVKIAVQ